MVLIRTQNSFKGLIVAGDRRYTFVVTEDESLAGSTLKVDWRLKKLLRNRLDSFLRSEFRDVYDFHDKFSHFICKEIESEGKCENWLGNPLTACTLIMALQEDMKTISHCIKQVDIEKRIVHVELVDAQFRTHKATLKLGQEYPKDSIQILQTDLPEVKTVFNENRYDFCQTVTVSEFCKKFESAVVAFQEFWNIISTVDMQCWVLDPPKPTYKDTYRRIKLSDTLSIGLTLDPLKPRQMPGMKLFGCQSDVDERREILQRNLEKEIWDSEADLIYNISNLLDVSVPNKMFLDDTDMFYEAQEEECAICFMSRLDEELPNEVCNHPTCRSIYHTICLFTYLSSIPKNREYFGKIQGECPNCDSVISCTMPKFSKTNN